ncbi:MAG: hypothetical protein ABSC48_02010 [Terracidiphilus sp.]|jgi:hypothetical protein
MKRILLYLTTAFLVVCSPISANSNEETVHYDWVFKSQSLSGTIRVGCGDCIKGASIDETSTILKGALVEEMTTDWKTVLSTTRTDENGHFSIPNPASKNLHYLRLSFYGCHTTYVKVRITRWTRKKEVTLFIQNS